MKRPTTGRAPAKRTSTRKKGATQATGTRGRTGATTKRGTSRAGTKTTTPRKPAQAASKGQQQSGTRQRQGDSTMSPHAAPMFGGTKQVLIEEVAMAGRGGRKQGPELYPFGELPPSRLDGGAIIGPSFFIPDSENPKKIIAAGRKRHKPANKIFLTRQMDGPSPTNPEQKVSGVRVWLSPDGQ